MEAVQPAITVLLQGALGVSPGVSGGERRAAEGRVGRCGAPSEVDASVHRHVWWFARFILLPYRSTMSYFSSSCLAGLFNCYGCACHCAIRCCFGLFGGRNSVRLGLGRHSTRRPCPFGLLLPVFQLLSIQLPRHLLVFTVLLLLNFASSIYSSRTIANLSP